MVQRLLRRDLPQQYPWEGYVRRFSHVLYHSRHRARQCSYGAG